MNLNSKMFFTVGKNNSRTVFLVRPHYKNNLDDAPACGVLHGDLFFPKELVGKHLRIKVELVDELSEGEHAY